MTKIETPTSDLAPAARLRHDDELDTLRDDELDAVSGGKVLSGRAKIVDGRHEVAPALVTVPTTHG
jgi:hypothetical protein